MPRTKRDTMIRVKTRPRPENWADDEPMTLAEAAAVFFPDGLLTVASLRTAKRKGNLATVTVAGKDLTTPRAIKEMVRPRPANAQAGSASQQPAVTPSNESTTAQLRTAHRIQNLRRRIA